MAAEPRGAAVGTSGATDRWSRLRPIVAYDLACHLLTVGLFAPLFGWLVAVIVRRTGDRVVSNLDLVAFALSPLGILLLLGSASLGLALLFLELGGLSVLILGSRGGRPVSALGALHLLGRRLRGLVSLGFGLSLRLGGILALCLGGILIAKTALLSDGDIYYYLQARPAEFVWAVSIALFLAASGLVVSLVVVARWILALPILLVEGRPAGESASLSREWVRRNGFGSMLRGGLIWALQVAALLLLARGVVWVVERAAFALAGDDIPRVFAAVGAVLAVDLVLGLAVGIVAALAFSRVMVDLYLELRPGAEAPEVVYASSTGSELARPVPAGLGIPVGLGVLAGLAVLAVLGLAWGLSALGRADLGHVVAVTAHRGSARAAPENTISALERAIEDGADYAEIDVQQIGDGELVLFHDTDLRRVAGDDRMIWEVSLEQFRQLDVGSWFAEEFAGERVATLAEAIDVARGRIGLNIELKINGHERDLEERVVQTVRRADFAEESFATSLDQASLERLARVDSELRRGLIVAAKVGDATRLDVELLAVNASRADRNLIARAHRAGQEVHVWTVNEPERMLAMIHMGVDNILTSEPSVLVALQAELRRMSERQRTLLYVSDLLDGRL